MDGSELQSCYFDPLERETSDANYCNQSSFIHTTTRTTNVDSAMWKHGRIQRRKACPKMEVNYKNIKIKD